MRTPEKVVPHNSKETIVVFKDGDGDLQNVMVTDRALATKYLQHRANEQTVNNAAMTAIDAAQNEFAEAASKLEAEYQAAAAALAKSRDSKIEAAQSVQDAEMKKLAAVRESIDKEAFALAEKGLAAQEAAAAEK